MRGGDLKAMPDDYIDRQYVIPTESYTAEGVWDIVDELANVDLALHAPLLSLGCCTGQECMQMRKAMSGRIVGVDVVPEAVKAAKIIAKNARMDLEFREADIHDLPFEDREFNTVYCRGTLEHCYNLKKAVSEIQRVAGRLIVITADLVPEGHEYVGEADWAFSDDPEEWKALFTEPGWELKHEWIDGSYRGYNILGMAWRRA